MIRYIELSQNERVVTDITIVESLLAYPRMKLHMNVIGQDRKLIIVALNQGQENYPLRNHMATFERRPEIYNFNPYLISQTILQLKNKLKNLI